MDLHFSLKGIHNSCEGFEQGFGETGEVEVMKNLKGKCIRCGTAIRMTSTYCRKCKHEFGLNTITPRVQRVANWLTAFLLIFAGVYFLSFLLFQ
ncbi:MAG: hypothetical protein D6E12_13910 [Desulfovibrio sp.]|nr:MAG: hypothetical protein D6E12_13910 [Desulfovibrio sp.]